MHAFTWPIEDIVTAYPALYLEHCAVMAVAMLNRAGGPAPEFLVACRGFCPGELRGVPRFGMRVTWDTATARKADQVWESEQPRPVVERAAVGLAALAFAKLVPGADLRVTRQGHRADFWLARLRCALEISGTDRSRELPRRERVKIAQVLSNPLRWNGYVFVASFAVPQPAVRWSYHEQEAQTHEPGQG